MEVKGKDLLSAEAYCFQSIQLLLKYEANLFGNSSTLHKLRSDEFAGWWRKLQGFLKSKPDISIEDVFTIALTNFFAIKQKKEIKDDKSYFFNTFQNKVYNYAKKKRLEEGKDTMDPFTNNPDDPRPDDFLVEEDGILEDFNLANLLVHEKALKKGGEFAIKIEEVSTFFSHEVYEWQLREMAKLLSIVENTLRSYNLKARKKIRKYLEKYHNKEGAVLFGNN
jgi:DNA-directed RNA polymerase specialized sigma24 family protein